MQSERMSMRLSSRQNVVRLQPKQFKDGVVQLIDKTVESLQHIWKQAGYEEVECQMLFGDILTRLQATCSAEITAEEQILEHAKIQVKEKHNELCTLSKQLGRNKLPSAEELGLNYADRLAELEKRISVISVEVNEREKLLKVERDRISELIECLGENPPHASIFNGPPGTPELSDVRLDLMKQYVSTLESLRNKREEDIRTIASECNRHFVDLMVAEEGTKTIADADKFAKYDSAIITLAESNEFRFGLHINDLEALRTRLKALVAEKEYRRVELAKTGSEIARLWTLLRIPTAERAAFQSSFQMNLSMATLARGRDELDRLLQIRAQSLGKVIESIRKDISALWEEIGIDNDELRKEEFPLFFESILKLEDSAVEEYESYYTKIKHRVEEIRPILQKISRREAVVQERVDLEHIMLNPERLTARGPKAREDRKREEDMMKRVKNLDKMNKELISQIAAWEEQNGLFTYGGERYSDRMIRQEEEYTEIRDQLRNARKKKDGKLEQLPRKKGSTTTSIVSSSASNSQGGSNLTATPRLKESAGGGGGGIGPGTGYNHAIHDQENSSHFDRNSTCSDDSNYTELTEIRERPSTCTVVRLG